MQPLQVRAGIWLVLAAALGFGPGCSSDPGQVPTATTTPGVTATLPPGGETLPPSPTVPVGSPSPGTPTPEGGTDTQAPETSTPGGDTSTPGGDTSTPGGDTSTPGGDTSTPGGDTSTPGGDTSTPGGDTSTPGGDTSTPGGGTSTPGGDTSTPGGDTSTPGEGTPRPPADKDQDGWTEDEDCNDDDADIYPGAAEICDGRDNDCDDATDEDGQSTWYTDSDGDGFGAGEGTLTCNPGAGFSPVDGDCDDNLSGVSPAASESCNEVDDNCDGQVDEGTTTVGWADGDNDGFGFGSPQTICDGEEGFADQDGDCDDGDPQVYPGAEEFCDGGDNDCDGATDEEGQSTYYTDADGDGYGTGEGTPACNPGPGLAPVAGDCDDADDTVNPGAEEVCDGDDDDCDGQIDDGATEQGYTDSDGDGWGVGTAQTVCLGSPGYASTAGDCDDGEAAVNPDASESCDGIDNDCDGRSDEGVTVAAYADGDGDGYGGGNAAQVCPGAEGYASQSGDCNDNDATINPGATETCDGKDNDCDSQIDEGQTGTFYVDADGDTWGTGSAVTGCPGNSGYASRAGDCDDTNPDINPDAREVCDGKDNDCDSLKDEELTQTAYTDADGDTYGTGSATTVCTGASGYASRPGDCDDTAAAINPAATEVCDGKDNDCDSLKDEGVTQTAYVDADGDTYGTGSATTVCIGTSGYATRPGDCNDSAAAINPAATETCDGKDNDCDSQTDEGLTSTGYTDADGDTYGVGSATSYCTGTSGYASRPGDCDDTAAAINPAATEICDGKDNDCDLQTDEGVKTTWYRDADGDGYGQTSNSQQACSQPSGYVAQSGDCNDNNAGANPGKTEICDTIDNDCDGQVDEGGQSTFYKDGDGDGYGLTGNTTLACGIPSGYASVGGDCNDSNPAINPGATETCDGTDNDCDTQIDEGVLSTFYRDNDNDTYGTASTTQACSKPTGYASQSGDCNDNNAAINPGATETCDGADNNCDTQIDEGVLGTYYQDADADGYGSSATAQACSKPSGYATQSGDCNDTDPNIKPGATELCDGKDNDCDGQADEGVTTTFYRDFDADSYGDISSTTSACSRPTGYVSNGLDCDDTDPSVYPGAPDLPLNGVDEDCDGEDSTTTDLDQDGFTDLVVPSYYNGTSYKVNSTVYFGSEAGLVTANRQDLPTQGAVAVCVADFDEDSYQDLVFVNYYDGTSYSTNSWLYYGGPSGYSTADRLDLPTIGARGCTTGDFDDDGDVDIVFVSLYSGSSYSTTSYVYRNVNGGFALAGRQSLATDAGHEVVADDLDGDGYMELIFSGYRTGTSGTYTTTTWIYRGSAAGYSATARVGLSTIGVWRKVAVADLNDDGAKDIVTANYYNGTTYSLNSYIYFGPAYSTTGRVDLPTTGPTTPSILDFDHDTYLDILLPSYYDGDDSVNSYVYFGSSRGYSSSNRQSLLSNRVYDAEVADVNDDTYEDIVLGVYYDGDYSTTSKIFLGSNIGFSASSVINLTSVGTSDVGVADFDGDGYLDVGLASRYDGDDSTTSYLHWGSPRGLGNANRTALATSGGAYETHIADLNRDSYPEVVYAAYYNGSGYNLNSVIYWGSATGMKSSSSTLLATQGATDICSGDLNGDGWPELVFANYYNGTSYAIDSYVYWGSATGYSTTSRTSLPTLGALSCNLSDIDKDGDLDILYTGYRNGNTYTVDSYIYWNTSGAFSSANRTALPGVGARASTVGDVNGDGRNDIWLSNYYNGSNYNPGSFLYFGTASGYTTSQRQTFVSHGPYRPAVFKDLNADSRPDITVFCYYDGDDSVNSYVYWNSATGFSDANKTTLAVNRTIDGRVADLDGDGRDDLLLVTHYDGNYAVNSYVYWGTSSGYSASNRQALAHDGAEAVELTDMDLDGYQDIVMAIYRDDTDYANSAYVWYGSATGYSTSRRSAVSSTGANSVAVGDLDADGLPDFSLAQYYDGSAYLTSSLVYYNSLRGFASNPYTSFSNIHAEQLLFVQ